MEHVKNIIVSICFDKNEMEVGELVSEGKSIYFKYYPSFIKSGLEISPIKLKLNNEVNNAGSIPFDGLYGVFADSLPDGWGKLLLDRALAAKGINVEEITMLDRLAYIGNNGMGALLYKPKIEQETKTIVDIELDKISKATQHIIKGTATDILDQLFKIGGSSGGARPKILVGYNPKTKHLIATDNNLPKHYQHWLIKFPASIDSKDIANIEFAYYKMALDAGIEMSECKLFKSKSGKTYFGTKRFDRDENKRFHLHSAAGMMHDDFRYSNLDYGNLMDCAFQLEKDVRAYEKILRLAAFNVFAHNRDDHSKNFAFLMNAKGIWKLAPAYDLTFSTTGQDMHSTMVAKESTNPTKKHLMELVDYFKIKNGSSIINEVQTVVFNWKIYAEQAEVSSASKNKIAKVICKK